MKELKLQNSCLVALVDDEDYERLSKFVWYVGKTFDVSRLFKRQHPGKTRKVSLASEVMHQHMQMFDHKDRNPLNNQKENLRTCSYSQNNANSTKRLGTYSLYRGVSWNKKAKKWVAYCNKDFARFHLGYFMLELDAAKAYNEKAKELFGEFANLNPV